MPAQRIGSITDVPEGKSKLFTVNNTPIGVFHVNEKWFAIYDKCSHRGGMLHEGERDGTVVSCPIHGAQFDITTGQNLSPPAPSPVKAYKIWVEGNDLILEI
ncbi:MAG: Rieske 2Fe-2S domain-containing protein [archaeon]